jgi:DNA-binding CsgD family transcriptional regulator
MDRAEAGTPDGVLGRFGVSAAAESVWLRLLESPTASPVDICEQVDITAAELDGAIEDLFAADLIRTAPTPTAVTAIDPALAIEAQMARAERDAAEQAVAFASIRTQLPALATTYARGRADAGAPPGFEIVVPVADIRRQISLASRAVRSNVRSIEHGPPGVDLTEGRDIQIDLLKRGVRDRLILDAAAVGNPASYEAYRDYQQYGHRTRTLPRLYHRLIVFDADLPVLPVDPARMSLGAIFIRVRSVIDLLSLIYDHLWTIATPLFDEPEDLGAPTGRPARILELLAIGNTDQRIARTLSVGERTVRREVSELKTALGVTSRAELPAAAIRKGWI